MPNLMYQWPQEALMARATAMNPQGPPPGLMNLGAPQQAPQAPTGPLFGNGQGGGQGGFFNSLEQGLTSPLFLAGAGLMSGGFPAALQGLQAGQRSRQLPLERMVKEAQAEYWRAKAAGKGVDAPSNVREWQYFNKLTPEQQQQYLTMKRAEKYLDLGTSFARPNPVAPGENLSTIAKDVAGEAAQRAGGKATGEAGASLASMRSKMPGLEQVVQELDDLSEKATYTAAGRGLDLVRRQVGASPRESAIARQRYIAMVNNQVLPLLRDTFGAAFTEREGNSLKATLGDPDASPAEKQEVLKAFIEQKRRDVEALEMQTGGSGATTGSTDDGWSARRLD